MAQKRLDNTILDITLSSTYKRIDNLVNPNDIKDKLYYTDLKQSLTNGNGTGKANLLYHQQSTLNNNTEFWDLDGVLEDIYGDLINFDAIKILVIHNRNTDANNFLDVELKNDRYYIGPDGYRVLCEPWARGLMAITSSASAEEGRIRVTSNANITYDIIIIGSSQENSSGS